MNINNLHYELLILMINMKHINSLINVPFLEIYYMQNKHSLHRVHSLMIMNTKHIYNLYHVLVSMT